MTYVDAVLGFKHLLTESDLDKALSMCSSLKGKLRSRFLVLSDDRIPPPPPNRGKRTLDEEAEDKSTKRNKFVPRTSGNPIPGVSKVGGSSSQTEKAGSAKRSTPNRFAKKTQPLPITQPAPMEEISEGSNSTEDWASSHFNEELT